MVLQPLYTIDLLSIFDKPLCKRINEYTTQVEAIERGREQLYQSYFDLKQGDVAEADFDNMLLVPIALKSTAAMLLQSELKARRLYDKLADEVMAAHRTAADLTAQQLEAKEAEIRAGLVALGYHDLPPQSPTRGKFMPIWIRMHEKVLELRERVESHNSQSQNRSLQELNREAMEQVEQMLIELRNRAASLGPFKP
jgi:hypothetical protein